MEKLIGKDIKLMKGVLKLKNKEVEYINITTLMDDYAGYETSFYAQHGISLLIDIYSNQVYKRILLDVSQEGKPILRNMDIMGIKPESIDAIFLTHCHYDHTKGLVEMLKAIGKEIPVIGHPGIFRDNYVLDPFLKNIGITEENGIKAIKEAGGQLFLTKDTFEIMPGVFSTGEVENSTNFETRGISAYNLEDGHLKADNMIDDLSIVVNVKDKGLVIITGCSHAGIINIIKHARKITGIEKIAAVIGGFHLIEAADERIEKTVDALDRMDIDLVVPGHCTGLKASAEIAKRLGNRFSQLHVGKTIDINKHVGYNNIKYGFGRR